MTLYIGKNEGVIELQKVERSGKVSVISLDNEDICKLKKYLGHYDFAFIEPLSNKQKDKRLEESLNG